jgi:hypothetical protein
MTLVCKDCGNEEKIKIYTPEEIKREGRRPGRPQCSKCGSTNVQLHD